MNSPSINEAKVSVSWLQKHLEDQNLVILYSGFTPVMPSTVISDDGLRIPHSREFDFDRSICDPNSSLPHMLPDPKLFEQRVRELGINQDSQIVIYDRVGIYSSPRVWWMFKAMGHDAVVILDGGLPAWKQSGGTVTMDFHKSFCKGNFTAKFQPTRVVNADEVEKALNDPHCVVLDARSQGRFLGHDAEPRPGLRRGHMPKAKNLPFPNVLNDGRLKSQDELKAVFASLLRHDQRLICSCGSGVTACIIALAAELAGYSNVAVYDGSWCEWGLPSQRVVVQSE